MYFGIIEDERDPYTITHPLVDILKLIMIAILCGMDELDKIIDYGKNKKEFLEKNFDIKLIPSKPTLTRVIALINTRINLDFLEIYLKNKPAFSLRNKNIGELIIGWIMDNNNFAFRDFFKK